MQEGRNNFGQNRQTDFNRSRGRFNGPREMHKATCSDCGAECQVPFKPREGRPVYCRACLPNHAQPKRDFDN